MKKTRQNYGAICQRYTRLIRAGHLNYESVGNMSKEQIIEDLLSALRVKRKAFQERVITFESWLHERRMIVREADFHGVTDELLESLGES